MHRSLLRPARLLTVGVMTALLVAGLGGAAPAQAVPLSCGSDDRRSAVDLRPKPGVVLQYLFDSVPPVVDFTAYTLRGVSETQEVYRFGPSGPYGEPIVGAWQNSTGCDGSDFTRNAWMALADGRVFADGDFHAGAPARHLGEVSHLRLRRPLVGMSATATGDGYWLVAGDGGVFSFGDARFHGSTGNIRLNKPVVGMSTTPTARGYWMVASDGGIFSFGDARFYGSTGGLRLNKPIIGMVATPTGRGYWLVASDGGVFTFGDATFRGSLGSRTLDSPVRGLVPSGAGYVLFTDQNRYVF